MDKPLAINMNISPDSWKKVGIMAAMQSATKRSIVEKAIELYYETHGIKLN